MLNERMSSDAPSASAPVPPSGRRKGASFPEELRLLIAETFRRTQDRKETARICGVSEGSVGNYWNYPGAQNVWVRGAKKGRRGKGRRRRRGAAQPAATQPTAAQATYAAPTPALAPTRAPAPPPPARLTGDKITVFAREVVAALAKLLA